MRILLVDNYDSFTYNLYQQLLRVGAPWGVEVAVERNDAKSADELLACDWQALVISPGPGGPENTGVCRQLLEAIVGRRCVLGVCLGQQFIAHYFGAVVRQALAPIHGKTWSVYHNGRNLFSGLPSPITAGRYHSLIVDEQSLSEEFSVDARSPEGEIMALSNPRKLLWGVQFHPESFLTPLGDGIVRNFLAEVKNAAHIL